MTPAPDATQPRTAADAAQGGHTPIPNWRGYAATPDGRIWSVATDWRGYGTRELAQELDRYFYRCVRLTVGNGTRKRFKVHRLIAETFLGPRPSPEHEVRHLDGDRSNNTVGNPAWGTRKDNADDRERHGRTYHMSTEEARRRAKIGVERRQNQECVA